VETEKRIEREVREYCPYCQKSYKIKISMPYRESGLSSSLIKPHEECKEFLIYLDTNGNFRGYQTIDSNYIPSAEESEDTTKYLNLFENVEGMSRFYQVIPLNSEDTDESNKLLKYGTIMCKNISDYAFIQSDLYKNWLNRFKADNEDFRFIYMDNIIIATINMYDMLILTIGFELQNFDVNLEFTDLVSVMDYIKGKCVSLGEKVLSAKTN
jgi:hypothetical protein